MSVEEKTLEELIEKTRQDFKNARRVFHEIFPKFWIGLLQACAESMSAEQFKETAEKTDIGLAEAREVVTKIWIGNIDGVFSLIKKQFQAPIDIKEAEKRALSLTNLLEEAVRFIIEELRTLDMMQEELRKIKK